MGGTGAMGEPLVQLLAKNNRVFVTSRSKKEDKGNLFFLHGNAKEPLFFNDLMSREYDVIVDFMVYKTTDFEKRLSILLEHTKQYIFFSSARVFADSTRPINEKSPRLVDVCVDQEYLGIDEYGIAKGRQENLLKVSGKRNWTIIRPYITYNTYRLQLGVYEKENWLKRALKGRTIVVPKDICACKTTLTFGIDVAMSIMGLVGNDFALGEIYNITSDECYTWGEILAFYCDEIEKITGNRPKVRVVDNSLGLQTVWNKWQILYDRLYNREFDNSKINSQLRGYQYMPVFEGLSICLKEFISNPVWLGTNVKYEAWCDRQCGEWTPLKEIIGNKNKLKYLRYRLFK